MENAEVALGFGTLFKIGGALAAMVIVERSFTIVLCD